jgi:hypothetical protein
MRVPMLTASDSSGDRSESPDPDTPAHSMGCVARVQVLMAVAPSSSPRQAG